MDDQFDVSLEDEELLDEVELTTSLIIAASECAHDYLSQEQIDAILEVAPAPPSRSSRHDAIAPGTIPPAVTPRAQGLP
jgi:hypothetical protein